jgi:hypothetical protein
MSYYFRRTTGNFVKMPYVVYLETYMQRRMWTWQDNKSNVTYRHPALERSHRALIRGHLTRTELALHKLTTIVSYYFRKAMLLPLVFLPWVLWRDRRFRPILLFLGAMVLALTLSEWVHPHYAAPFTCAFIAIQIQCLRHLRVRQPWGRYAVVVILAGTFAASGVRARKLALAQRDPHPGAIRAQMVRTLEATGEKHLVIVRDAEDMGTHREWVYNLADIDSARVVWAREMANNTPLLNYFRDRRIWLVEPNRQPPRLTPYR